MRQLHTHYDVIVIGGGATGAGTARDCALRGLKVLLVERFDFTAGATGRNHGLLHSGARYAVNDPESARECIVENRILRRIARHCVEDTGGLFITLPEDDLDYQKKFIESCQASDIEAVAIDPEEARRIEPAVNPDLVGAVKVPDCAIDPFRLTTANVIDARRHGADVLTYHEVVGFIRSGDRIEGVIMRNQRTGEEVRATANIVINAGGIWGHLLAEKAGINISMVPAKGALLIFGHRVNNTVINRCRKPSNADILVPGDSICLIGTTSDKIGFDEVDNMDVTPREVDQLITEGMKLSPKLKNTRILRAFAGVRPLVADDSDPSGRSVSRGIVCLDHAKRDGVEGLISITGGKLTTYRQMAEDAADLACKKLGVNAKCQTAELPLPGSDTPAEEEKYDKQKHPLRAHTINLGVGGDPGVLAAEERHGSMAEDIRMGDHIDDQLVCECEQVNVGEVKFAIEQLNVRNMVNLRRRTRLGMGTCQGQLCACRAAGLLDRSIKCTERTLNDLVNFVNERWKGMKPVGWGSTVREIQFTVWEYIGVAGLDEFIKSRENDELPK